MEQGKEPQQPTTAKRRRGRPVNVERKKQAAQALRERLRNGGGVTATEAAMTLGVSYNTLRRWVAEWSREGWVAYMPYGHPAIRPGRTLQED